MCLAPFRYIILAVLSKGQDHTSVTQLARDIALEMLDHSIVASDILIDDRTDISIGARLREAELIGYPSIVIVGKTLHDTGMIEVISRTSGQKRLIQRKDNWARELN